MNNLNPMELATSPAIWILAGTAVVLILIETILFLKMAYKGAKHEDVMLETKGRTIISVDYHTNRRGLSYNGYTYIGF